LPLFAKSDFNSPIIAPLKETGFAGLAGAGFGPGGGGGGAPPGGPPGGGPGGPPGGLPGGDGPGGLPGAAVDVTIGLDLRVVISPFNEFMRVSRDVIC